MFSFRITLVNNYGVSEFEADLVKVFIQAWAKKTKTIFLETDSQVLDEQFLIYISDFISTGVLPEIFSQEDKEGIFQRSKGIWK
jgi:dynein heavy chain